MSAAIDFAAPSPRETAFEAEIVRGDRTNHAPEEARALRVGRRAVVLEAVAGLAPGQHAWVRLTLPDGTKIRPLVQITTSNEREVAGRIVHLFPNEQRLFDAYHAARATPHGY